MPTRSRSTTKDIPSRPPNRVDRLCIALGSPSNAAVARSTITPKRVQSTNTSKSAAPTIKPSTSQSNVKKVCATPASSKLVKSQRDPAPIPVVDRKDEAAPQSVSSEEDVEPVCRIRSGSYTISRPTTAPQDQNRNLIKDQSEDSEIGGNEAPSPRMMGRGRPAFTEDDFRASIGRRVLGNNRIGILRYFGPVNFMEGLFCGIELDQPFGLHDGQFNGVRYFKTNFKHGTFLSMDHVLILDDGPGGSTTSVWPDGELLTDVEPNLLEGTLNDSMMSSSAATFDLSSSLSFLKSSRFPGMDASLTPSELMAQLHGQDGQGTETEREALFNEEGECSGMEASSPPRIVEQSHFKSVGFIPSQFSTSGNKSQSQGLGDQYTKMLASSLGSQHDATMRSGDWTDPDMTPHRFDAMQTMGNCSSMLAASAPTTYSASLSALRGYKQIPNDCQIGFTHAVKGFDAMSVLVQHYAEKVIPDLKCKLATVKDQISACNNARLNMENENRLLKDYYDATIQQQRREYEQKVQQLQAECERRIAENSDQIRKSVMDEHRVLLSSKSKEVQQFKAEVSRLEKMIRNSNSEVESMKAVSDFRSKDFHHLQEKCNGLEKELEDSNKMRQNVTVLQQKNNELTNALEKKTQVESLLMEKIDILEESLRRENEWNRHLRMGKEELEFKLTQSMYEGQSGFGADQSPFGGGPSASHRSTSSRIKRRSKSVAVTSDNVA